MVYLVLFAMVLVACAALRRSFHGADVFFAVILGTCFVFRQRGLWALPAMLIAYHWSGMGHGTFARALIEDLFALMEWCFLGFFIIVSLGKYSDVKAYDDRIRTDMHLAMTLQRSLMPKPFETRCVRVDSLIHQTLEIGGDFYFYRPFDKRYVIYCLGDIMGKGISASLVMAMVLGFFYEWGKSSHSPGYIMTRLNERLISVWGSDAPSFATMFYSIYDEESRELVYCCAGHHGALRVNSEGEVSALDAEGIPLGVFPDFSWEERRVTLAPGDRIVVFTDGVNEARNAGGQIFTMARVRTLLSELRGQPGATTVQAVVDRVTEFVDGEVMSDDIAVLCMEVRG